MWCVVSSVCVLSFPLLTSPCFCVACSVLCCAVLLCGCVCVCVCWGRGGGGRGPCVRSKRPPSSRVYIHVFSYMWTWYRYTRDVLIVHMEGRFERSHVFFFFACHTTHTNTPPTPTQHTHQHDHTHTNTHTPPHPTHVTSNTPQTHHKHTQTDRDLESVLSKSVSVMTRKTVNYALQGHIFLEVRSDNDVQIVRYTREKGGSLFP